MSVTSPTDAPTGPAHELAQLVRQQRTEEAIALCERWAAHPVLGEYYGFWLERLRSPLGAAEAPGSESGQHRRTGSGPASLRPHVLAEGFAQHPYQFGDEPLPASAELMQVREALLAASSFKGEIYLPTTKVPPAQQVQGLRRVRDLVLPANREASRQRFELLRRAVREAGVRRVFVIGNGPSLKKTDLALLEGEVTIGFNGIFLHESFTPTIYVVEDHLVAEDRVAEIHAFRCPVKIFPSYLGYCIRPQENTIFLNHRPRISYPVDTDFSADAGRITYTGGTVTYTGLQIAASLGVEEIVLLGVDASYRVHDVERSDTYGTGVLTSRSDDTNHFDPRYFGKGYRWHDPNVHTMLQAYRKAREHGRANGVRFVNATLGGQLEVFPRVDFHALFPTSHAWPRLAVLDFTPFTRLCATGIVKKHLLKGWARCSQLHLYSDDRQRIIAFQSTPHDLYAPGSDDASVWPAFRSLVEYDPEVMYLRPTADRFALTIVQAVAAAVLGRPFVVHYMDDWLARAAVKEAPAVAAAYRELMDWLFANAAGVLAISPKMAEHLAREHGVPRERVSVVHNFVPAMPSGVRRAGAGVRLVRYFGGIEPDMGLATLLEVARQVEALPEDGPLGPVRLEIRTTTHGIARHGAAFAGLQRTTLAPQIEDDEAYLGALAEADLNLACYNFDEDSVRYVRHSLANKLPDLLAAGAPFVAIGHAEIGTIGLLMDLGYPLVAAEPSFDFGALMERALRPHDHDRQALEDALTLLRQEFSDESNRLRLHALLRRVAHHVAAASVPPLRALAVLHDAGRAAGRLAAAGDLDMLMRLPQLPPALLDPALRRIRSHGRDWSVRDEAAALAKDAASAEFLAGAATELQARALATLVCGLGAERFQAVNAVTRDWLRRACPVPGASVPAQAEDTP